MSIWVEKYKKDWLEGGDELAGGTREDLINDLAEKTKFSSKDEIANWIYNDQMTNEWMSAQRPPKIGVWETIKTGAGVTYDWFKSLFK